MIECPCCSPKKILEPWLSGAAGVELLKPASDDLLER
jgi:hypothetical protein